MRSLFLIFFFCYVTGKAQDRACVVSEKDSIPLSNVYICLKDRRVIAISDEKGVFSLEKYDSLSLNDTLYFSHINYLHKKLSYGDLIKNRCTVFLKENNRVLEEVSIFSNRHLNRFLHYEILSPLKRGVYSFASVLVDGQIYIVGGSTSCGPFQSNIRSTLFWEKYSNMMYRYDIKQDKWETIRHKFRERAYHTAGYYDGKIFILGGKRLSETRIVDYLDNAIEIYDIKRDTVWTDYTNPHQATLLGSVVYKDNMIVLGGVKKVLQNNEGVYSDEMHLWNLKSGYWYELGKMPIRQAPDAILVDHCIYLIGNRNGGGWSIECYNLLTGAWTNAGHLLYRLGWPSLAYHNDIIYIFEQGVVQTFNIKSRQVRSYMIDLKLKSPALYYFDGKLYILGGFYMGDPSRNVYSVDLKEFDKTEVDYYYNNVR